MDTVAVLLEEPRRIALRRLALSAPGEEDVVVDVEWSGISTGTERLLWSGRMPSFPGLGYPLVPGYEAVGRVAAAGPRAGRRVGERVFVPGARCFGEPCTSTCAPHAAAKSTRCPRKSTVRRCSAASGVASDRPSGLTSSQCRLEMARPWRAAVLRKRAASASRSCAGSSDSVNGAISNPS